MQTDYRNEWLSKLGQRVTIPALSFDSAGLCQLSLDDELMITIYKPEDSNYLVLFGQLPIDAFTPALAQKMLIENRNHSKYLAPVFSLSDDLDAIEVHFKLSKEEVEESEDVLDELVGNLEYWRTYLTV